MSRYGDERVLVIRRSLFEELGVFEGFHPEVDGHLDRILDPRENLFLLREDAEEDPSYKQIIPYVIFRHEDLYLHYVRGKKTTEARLQSKGSIGIGGHVNQDDSTSTGSLGREMYFAGVEREIREELVVRSSFTQSVVGMINDDSSEVGRVHLGVVHLFELETPNITSNEEGICDLQFLSLAELEQRMDRLETWSQSLVPRLQGLGHPEVALPL
ncbi:MAG: hypothetical protein AAF191_10885 [Verrucomicrobiota bacterium]